MKKKLLTMAGILSAILLISGISFAAYHHMNEKDSPQFISVYGSKKNTKLDSCALCHSGGEIVKNSGKVVKMGSCQWCHHSYGYDASGNIVDTLNPYGKDYYMNGRNADAIRAIANLDSDKDGFSNIQEIEAIRYPGDANDDPEKMIAPYRVYTKDELKGFSQHTQFMLMNTHRSGDFYAEYTGVPLEDLLEDAEILDTATGITVYAPDGWSTNHPLDAVDDPNLYHIKGIYPPATFYHMAEAEEDWCDYSSPPCNSYSHSNPIHVSGGLKALLALQRDGVDLETGILDDNNYLNGDGPYRIVVPQKVPCPPDQSAKSANQNVEWAFNEDWDHNAGFCTRSVTIIKVEPLPEGTTDIDVMEAGWDFVDEEKIIIYGAIKGQTGQVSGEVFTLENEPFENITATIVETGHKATTNNNGTFIIENVPVGTYQLSIKNENNVLLVMDHIVVSENQDTQLSAISLPSKQSTCDIDGDNRIGLTDLIHWFRVLAGLKVN